MKRVLVVENDLDYRETIRDLLDREHYDVILAKDAREALEGAKKKPHLAVVDIRLIDDTNPKDVSGIDLIPSLPTDIPIIVLSANNEVGTLQKILNMAEGRIHYLFKVKDVKNQTDWSEPDELVSRIGEILNRKRTAWFWMGWGLIALSVALIYYFWREKKEFLNMSFYQGIVSNLVVNVMWLAGGWMIRRTS